VRSQAQLSGAGRRAEVEGLRSRVEELAAATDHLLDTMHGVMAALARLASAPDDHVEALQGELGVVPPGELVGPGEA
jgi:hypothetical protein